MKQKRNLNEVAVYLAITILVQSRGSLGFKADDSSNLSKLASVSRLSLACVLPLKPRTVFGRQSVSACQKRMARMKMYSCEDPDERLRRVVVSPSVSLALTASLMTKECYGLACAEILEMWSQRRNKFKQSKLKRTSPHSC